MKKDDKPTPGPDTKPQPQGPPDEVPPIKPKPLDGEDPPPTDPGVPEGPGKGSGG
jgi:hypothetical protein